MIRRILGLVILIATLVVIVLLFGGAIFWSQTVDSVAVGLDNGLATTVDSLTTVSATLAQTQATLVAFNTTLDNATQTTVDLATAVGDTIPLLDQVSNVVAEQVPNNIEAVQTAIPNVAAVAGVVDQALTTLSEFGIRQTIPLPFNPIEIDFDLGFDYQPIEPFDQSLIEVGDSLDGLPDELRKLRTELEVSTANLQTVSDDILIASGDIETINTELEKFIPLLDQYLALLDEVSASVEELRTQITANLSTIKLVGTILLISMSLTQLAPLVVGWELLTGKRESQVVVKDVTLLEDDGEIKAQVEVEADSELAATLAEASQDDES